MPTRTTRGVTSRDVARESGVSQATVSYVINNVTNQTISPETRKRVLRAAEKLGYIPSEAARTLRSGRSNMALLVLPDVELGYAMDQLIAELAEEFERLEVTLVLHRLALGMLTLRRIWQSITPSLVLSLGTLDAHERTLMQKAGIDVIESLLTESDLDSNIGVHDYQQNLGRVQAERLVAAGHGHIAYALPDDPGLDEFALPRLEGVRAVAAERGLIAVHGTAVALDVTSAQQAVESWHAADVTAVACYNDDIALAVLSGIRAAGLSCPLDMAVIGLDAIPLGAVAQPPLTSVRIDMSHLARQFAILAERLRNPQVASTVSLESVRATVIERTSV